MMSVKTFALSSAFPVSFALCLLLAGPAAASEQDSSPAEQAQTQRLNQGISNANSAADAQNAENNADFQAQQSRYQEQLAVYRAGQKDYQERAASYEAARERYVSGHARYHRSAWPARYEQRLIVDTNELLGARVHTSNGRTVGHVAEIALASGRVDALRVTLDNSRGDVWIESADLRFDADKKVVMTNLNRRDLYVMTRESY
jgi:sporulation protein YlmC with PRC-barrel domain